MAMTTNDRQVGGTHYKKQKYQHWDFATDVSCNDFYLKGCASKYVVRYRDKNGIEDLSKAVHYLDKIEERGCYSVIPFNHRMYLKLFAAQFEYPVRRVIWAIYTNRISRARKLVQNLIMKEF